VQDDIVPTSDKINKKRLRSKTPELQVDLSGFIAELKEKGKKVTVAALKQACSALGVKVSGKKDELYDRVVGSLTKRGMWESDGEESEEEVKPKKKAKRVVDDDDE
jgi:hypothetical protein